jgi:hypothetical protein
MTLPFRSKTSELVWATAIVPNHIDISTSPTPHSDDFRTFTSAYSLEQQYLTD